jgi:hypothetical protein
LVGESKLPFKSAAQQRFLEANPDKIGGADKLKEWESETDYANLPEHVPSKRKVKSKPKSRLRKAQ